MRLLFFRCVISTPNGGQVEYFWVVSKKDWCVCAAERVGMALHTISA